MSNKFEQLIEYVINEEDAKASELFHEIVVEKSRNIYEDLMSEEEVAEETVTEMGGDEVDDFINDIEADEEGMDAEEDEIESDDMDFDADGETDEHEDEHEELEDRVVDLEDKLDELMAEFDDLIADDTEAPAEEEMEMESAETETEEVVREYTEKAPKPVTSDNSDSTTSPVASKNDMGGKAVDPTGEEKGRSAPKAKDMDAKGPQDAGNLEAAPKPVTKA